MFPLQVEDAVPIRSAWAEAVFVFSFDPSRQTPRQVQNQLHGISFSLFLGHAHLLPVSPSRYWVQLRGDHEGGFCPLCELTKVAWFPPIALSALPPRLGSSQVPNSSFARPIPETAPTCFRPGMRSGCVRRGGVGGEEQLCLVPSPLPR